MVNCNKLHTIGIFVSSAFAFLSNDNSYQQNADRVRERVLEAERRRVRAANFQASIEQLTRRAEIIQAETRAYLDAVIAEGLEAERVEAEKVEAERVEAERLEAERVERERVDIELLYSELSDDSELATSEMVVIDILDEVQGIKQKSKKKSRISGILNAFTKTRKWLKKYCNKILMRKIR